MKIAVIGGGPGGLYFALLKSNRFCRMSSTGPMGEFNYFLCETTHGIICTHAYRYQATTRAGAATASTAWTRNQHWPKQYWAGRDQAHRELPNRREQEWRCAARPDRGRTPRRRASRTEGLLKLE